MNPYQSFGDKIPKGYKSGQLQQFSPEQIQLFQSLFSHLGPESYLSRLAGGDENIFRQIEQPAMRQFGEYQGSLASRFSGQGTFGSRRSSGFQNMATTAGANLAENLAAQRQALQMNAIRELMGMSGDLLQQRPYERFMYEKPEKKALGGWGGLVGGVGGGILGSFVGMPGAGAAIGASAMSGL